MPNADLNSDRPRSPSTYRLSIYLLAALTQAAQPLCREGKLCETAVSDR